MNLDKKYKHFIIWLPVIRNLNKETFPWGGFNFSLRGCIREKSGFEFSETRNYDYIVTDLIPESDILL